MKLSQTEIDKWRQIGRDDQRAGIPCVPLSSPSIKRHLNERKGAKVGETDTAEICKAWLQGWTSESLHKG